MKPSFPVLHAPLAITAFCLLMGGCQVLNSTIDGASASPAGAQPALTTATMSAPQAPFDETPITPMETVGASRGE